MEMVRRRIIFPVSWNDEMILNELDLRVAVRVNF